MAAANYQKCIAPLNKSIVKKMHVKIYHYSQVSKLFVEHKLSNRHITITPNKRQMYGTELPFDQMSYFLGMSCKV